MALKRFKGLVAVLLLGVAAASASSAPLGGGIAHAGPVVAELFVPVTTIYPGEALSVEKVRIRRFRVRPGVARNYAGDVGALSGRVAKRTLPAGRAIPLTALREPYRFREGQHVTMRFISGRLQISAVGVALEPGIAGRYVALRNIDSGVTVRGRVTADGAVEVRAP